jgi:hypothetical protein
MSLNGQIAVPTIHPPVPDWDGPLYAQARVYPSGHRLPPHSHPTAQLLYAATGVMTVLTEAGVWVAPPQRAVWIPAGTEHETTVRGELSLHSLFIWPHRAAWMPAAPAVVGVTPLLRALILAAIDLPAHFATGGREERILNLILDEMRALSTAPLHLPEPSDRRLGAITEAIRRQRTHAGAAVPVGNRHDIRRMAAAGAPAGGAGGPRRRPQCQPGRLRCGI